ncbi:MAG: DUF6763 family protein [Steroidobacteraceae bacterium]
MSRDYEPKVGQWYEDLETEETFQVLSVDPDEEILRIQWPDREIQELDLDAWNEMDLELALPPEGWVDDVADEEDLDDDEDDWEDDEDEDDDWDEDDDDEDDDYDDDDDYRDRERSPRSSTSDSSVPTLRCDSSGWRSGTAALSR